MQYWLRKNNIEKGPFTKEALFSQGISAKDLIRIDGESLWQPASEIQSLHEGFKSASKPKYKFTADKQLIEIKETAKKEPTQTVKKPDATNGSSPFKRMPSAVPKKKAAAASTEPISHPKSNPAKKEQSNTKQDKAHEPVVASMPSASHQKQHVQPQIQSIDDAPLKEIKHRPTPKPIRNTSKPQNSNFFKEFFLPIVIIGVLGLLAWWGFNRFTAPAAPYAASSLDSIQHRQANMRSKADSPSNDQTGSNVGKEVAALPMHPSTRTSTKSSKDTSTQAPTTKTDKSSQSQALAQAKVNQPKEESSLAEEAQKKAQQAAAKTASKLSDTKIIPVVKKTVDTPAPTKTVAPTPEKTSSTKTAQTKTPAKKAPIKISDYISLSLNKQPEPGIKNVKINVHNSSEEDLNIAVIEVKYYDKDGKFIQGETLQSGKINAGKSTTLKIPNSKNAERITYKVSLISGDNVYLMGQ